MTKTGTYVPTSPSPKQLAKPAKSPSKQSVSPNGQLADDVGFSLGEMEGALVIQTTGTSRGCRFAGEGREPHNPAELTEPSLGSGAIVGGGATAAIAVTNRSAACCLWGGDRCGAAVASMSAAGALELVLRGSSVDNSEVSFELPGRPSKEQTAPKSSIAIAP